MKITRAVVLALLAAPMTFAGGADPEVLRVANWLVGSFDNRGQVQAEVAGGPVYKHEIVGMTARPIEDPVDFGDGLYLYVDMRDDSESRPHGQRVLRLKKSGGRTRVEVFEVEGQVLALLATDPKMLTQLSSHDLTKEAGCDVVLELKGEEFVGSTAPKTCKSDWKGAAYMTSTLRVSKDLVVVLARGYDEKGTQTFGPTDGRGYEFRRTPQ